MQALFAKYYHPNSLTWWTGVLTLLSGLLIQFAPTVPPLAPIAALAAGFFPGHAGGELIIAGLGLVGIKSSIVDSGAKAINAAVDLVKSVNEVQK